MLTMDSPLPPQSVSLKVTMNKVRLINLITDNIHKYTNAYIADHQYIIVSGSSDVPIKLTAASPEPEDCADLYNTHEEADTIIIHHVVEAAKQNGVHNDVMIHMCLSFSATSKRLSTLMQIYSWFPSHRR